MKTVGRDGKPVKCIKIDLDALQAKAVYFATKNTMSFFQKLNLKTDFLELPIKQCYSNFNFQKSETTIQALSVVNDYAEREVALTQEYSEGITRDKEKLQFLLQMVADWSACSTCIDKQSTFD